MQVTHEIPSGANPDGHSTVVRLLRGLCFTLLANPLAFVVAGISIWLLTQLILGVSRARAAGLEWDLSDFASFGGLMVVLSVLACLALGHIALMWVVGWRGNRF